MKSQTKQLALALLLTAFACATAHAQCYTDPLTGQRICTRQVSPSTLDGAASHVDSTGHCRITVADGTMGSGTLVGKSDTIGLVLTCSHLFNSSKSNIIVAFPNGRRFAANLIDLDRANDLAALAIRRPDFTPLTLSEVEPAGILTACGFGPNGVFRSISGGITGHPTAAGATYPSITITGAVRPGDSGGGVLNSQDQVTGVIWGQRDGQTYATCGQPLREFLTCVRGKLFGNTVIAAKPTNPQSQAPSPQFDWQTWTGELDARIRALDAKKQDKGDYLQPGDLNRYLKIDDATKITDQYAPRSEIESKLKGIFTQFESVHTVVESVRQHVEQIAGDRSSVLGGVSLGKFAVGALGLSGPLAAAVIIAGGLLGRRLKTRIKRLEAAVIPTLNPQPSTLNHVPIAVDSPPPPQRTVPETHYVPIEKDSFAKAHQWASEHVARKYPGATEVLQAQDSLIKQFLAAK
jgi:Trypsin-like peptidase domain